MELFITFQLVFTVFATCDPNRHDLKGSAALAIGLSVCVGHLFAVGVLGLWLLPHETIVYLSKKRGGELGVGGWETELFIEITLKKLKKNLHEYLRQD